ncbi:hypothetical protein [Vibrio phage phiKT1028]|nr:hypothetical protein [Vibrio phage phiKT1028]
MHIPYIQKLAIISAMASVRGEVMVIKAIHEGAKDVWEHYREKSSGSHLIEGVAFSNLKTESLKSFGAAVLKLALNAKGKTLNGFSDEMIVEESERFTSTLSRLAAVKELNFNFAFEVIMSAVVGYDQWLIRSINQMEETPEAIAHLTLAYGVRKFEMADMDYAETMLLSNLDEAFIVAMHNNRDTFWCLAFNLVADKDYLDAFEMLKDIVAMDCEIKAAS